jgi:ribosome-associated translation inhibitor RaiA
VGKSEKRQLGRTPASETPLDVRSRGVPLDDRFETYVRERAGRKLGKLAYYIERVRVRFDDLNGPKHGVDIACQVHVVLSGLPPVVLKERAADPRVAFDLAIASAERVLERELKRFESTEPK